jgi:NRPS condensation-like uncharacterized protein
MRFLPARTPGSDKLLAAAHHAASDGIGTLRLMTSLARAYAGRPDPTPDIDPVASRQNHGGGGHGPAVRVAG